MLSVIMKSLAIKPIMLIVVSLSDEMLYVMAAKYFPMIAASVYSLNKNNLYETAKV